LFETEALELSSGDVLIAIGAGCRRIDFPNGVDCEWLLMPAALWASLHPGGGAAIVIREVGATAAELLVLDYLKSWRDNFDHVASSSALQYLDVLGRLMAMARAGPEPVRDSGARGA
jgi:hypothetical protein